MRYIGEEELDHIAVGAAILGCGGGGDPHVGKLLARAGVRATGPVALVDLDAVDDDALIVPVGMLGATTVATEKLTSLDGMVAAVETISAFYGRPVDYTIPVEVGGLNSLIPFAAAGDLGVPVVDADLMGRAFPEVQMALPTLLGISASPVAMSDEKGNAVLLRTIDNRWTERFARSVAIDMGATTIMALYAMTGRQLKQAAVVGSLTQAEGLGRAIATARADHVDVVTELLGGQKLFTGKVVDVDRRTIDGFARGRATLEGLGPDDGRTLTLRSQNEHLVAERDGVPVATTPDLIMVLATDSAEPITTETLRYGFRVTVLAAPCDERYRTEEGLALVGPRYFGYDIDYAPITAASSATRAR
jgi:DUF917 family protein